MRVYGGNKVLGENVVLGFNGTEWISFESYKILLIKNALVTFE